MHTPPSASRWGQSGEATTTGVVLVTIDSLRADTVLATDGMFPTLDRLANQGVTFTDALAHGNWTPFSFPAILGSEHVFAQSADLGPGGGPTLPEVLSRAEVATAGYNAANGFLSSFWGYDRGFDEYESFIDDAESGPLARFLAAHPTVGGWLQYLAARARRWLTVAGIGDDQTPVDVAKTRAITERATDFLAAVDGPFFLWVHYMDAHLPYLPAPESVEAVTDESVDWPRTIAAQIRASLGRSLGAEGVDRLRSLYRGGVRQVDTHLDELLETLETRGLRDETCVVVAGDHGEEFQDHGHLSHYPKLYDELVRVPLIVDHPHGASDTVDRPVGLDGVAPTVCDLLGVDTGDEFTGGSFAGSIRSGAAPDPRPVLSVTVRGSSVTSQPIPRYPDDGELLVSARTDEWTYIYHAESGREELYDRVTDPREQEDLATDPDVQGTLGGLRAAAQRYLDGLAIGDGEGESAPSAVERRLSALGYR